MVRYYLSEWGRMIRTDGTIPQYAPTPLAVLQSGPRESAGADDPVMDTVFRVMAQINRLWPQLYRFEWDVYVSRLRVVEVASAEGCSKQYVHQWLRRGEEYLGAGLGVAVAEEAVVELKKYYAEKSRNRPIHKEKIDVPRTNRPKISLTVRQKV